MGWPVLFWLCRVEIITERGQDVQMFINDQHGHVYQVVVGESLDYLLDIAALSELEAQAFRYTRMNIC